MAEILASGKQRSGKNSRIVTDGATLAMAKWDTNHKGDDLDTVNFESAGLGEGILGIEEVELSFGGDWDAGMNYFDDPPGLYPRDDLPDTAFYENVNDVVFYDFPYIRLRSATNGAEVRGKVSFGVSGMSQGTWSSPTGSV